MAEFVLDFLRVMCERDIFGVDPAVQKRDQKGIKGRERNAYGHNKNTTFHHSLQTHTPLSYCKTTHTRQKRAEKRGAMIMLMMTHTTPTTTPSDDVPPLFLRCF